MSKPDLLSLQGELCLAKIVNGVAGALLPVGNMPTLKLKISSDKVDHYDSRYGQRAKDATLYKQTGVDVDGELDTVNKTSLALVMSGNSISIASETITDRSLGTVTVGSIIDLGLQDGSNADIDSSKYILDAVYGTVEFIQSVTGAVKWSGTAAAKTRTTIANNTGSEYKVLFKGIDTISGDKVVVELHRLTLSPETEFDLINEDFNKFSITGSCMADNSKANDAELSVFGHIDRFSVTA